jgi:beta-phosphoglucomutase-like phosphatase (HAD superfamily)
MGLADLADHVVSSARVGVAQPDREIYEIAAGRAGVALGRCLFVDDRLENIEAAVTLGMTGVHYRRPDDLREALSFLPNAWDLHRTRGGLNENVPVFREALVQITVAKHAVENLSFTPAFGDEEHDQPTNPTTDD